MKKMIIWIILILFLIFIGIFIGLNNSLFTGRVIQESEISSATIAICNKTNYCEDYEIICDKEVVINSKATGFSIQHEEEWKDPRGEQKENLCE